MNELVVRLPAGREAAEACLNSIRSEIDSTAYDRSSVDLVYDGELVLHIKARDLHALRAAANTYLRWLDMCLKLTG